MATQQTLPLVLATLPLGLSVLGSVALPQGATWARLEFSRTAGLLPLSGLPNAHLSFLIESSQDNGLTWQREIEGTDVGGAAPYATNVMTVQPIAGNPQSSTRMIRASITTDTAFSTSGQFLVGS